MSILNFRSPAGAPEFIGWRFVADGHRQGFFDYRLTAPEDFEDGILPDSHPAWLEQDADGWWKVD